MPDRDLQIGFWVLTLKPILHRVGFGLLVAFDVLFVALLTLQIIRYANSNADYESLIASLAKNTVKFADVTERMQRPELVVDQAIALADTGGEFELVAIVRNPSSQWMVTDGHGIFLTGDINIGASLNRITMLPGETRYLTVFHITGQHLLDGQALSLQFDHLAWQRVSSARPAPSVELSIQDPAFHILSNMPSNQLSQVTGTLVNGTVHPYAAVTVTALLMRSGTVVAAQQLTVENITGLEHRPIDLRFYKALNITNVLIGPTVDLTTIIGT